MNPIKLLIKFPTRNRPEKFFTVLEKYIKYAKNIKLKTLYSLLLVQFMEVQVKKKERIVKKTH